VVSLGELIPESIGNMDEHIKEMLAETAPPGAGEYELEEAPRGLLECMVLNARLKNVGHDKGLLKGEREALLVLLNAAVALKPLLLLRISERHPEIRKGVRCTNLRNDGHLYNRVLKPL
jgi:hypothetical protein